MVFGERWTARFGTFTFPFMTDRPTDGDYLLGTEDDEITRLGLQHAVWRPRATSSWQRAGFSPGSHIVDVGCGPGYATFDLSDIVGPGGTVTAIDRSRRFLEHLAARLAEEPHRKVETMRIDFDVDELPAMSADAAWCRWVFAFVTRPRELLRGIRRMLRPGASLVLHEYFDYGTFRLVPADPAISQFVDIVKASWQATGGEPDIALSLLSWLPLEGFRIKATTPFIDVVAPTDFIWQWPATFIQTGVWRMVELGNLTSDQAAGVIDAFARNAANPHGRLITPGVLEIIAVAED